MALSILAIHGFSVHGSKRLKILVRYTVHVGWGEYVELKLKKTCLPYL